MACALRWMACSISTNRSSLSETSTPTLTIFQMLGVEQYRMHIHLVSPHGIEHAMKVCFFASANGEEGETMKN